MADPAPSPPTWLDACAAFALRHGIAADLVGVLEAFVTDHPRGGPPPPPEMPWTEDFEALESSLAIPLDVGRLAAALASNGGGGQPGMFARRIAATESILQRLHAPDARLLRVGLRVRLHAMLTSGPPPLRRVRALADFYYSHAARLQHPAWVRSRQHLEDMVTSMRWARVVPGIEHALLDGLADAMPIHANLLRLDPSRVRVRAEELGAVTREGMDFAAAIAGRAVAGISGGYFLYSEPDIEAPSRRHDPVGLLIVDGTVRSPPVFARAALLVGESGRVELRRVALEDVGLRIGGCPATLARTWNRAETEQGPSEPSIAVVGREVLACGRTLPVPLNGFVATLDGDNPPAVRPGASVDYDPPRLTDGSRAVAGVGGGPFLLQGGRPVLDMRVEEFWGSAPPITFSQDETGDRNLLARMAVGLDEQGRLLVAAVDGRHVQRALGMTLADVSRLLLSVGCHTALNLDGGSSKRMVVQGRVVDLPSTEIVAGDADAARVRPVHSALLFNAR